ncbi:WD40-repeat-containing domain protein [Catenaria anguillulae PL171]|uniref:WD40-repeat-containing domain protein n=1 Tax=Catenaria anguillulae PL171 TaxID=765915 RepID=A0A1Y2I0M0_9FUNG|nr:WD40-repeat-containing domain protein [Catenaria anguillulae PL171]
MESLDPTLERAFRGHKDGISALSFKPNLTQLASASLDHSIMVWNFRPGMRGFRFLGHKAPVTNVEFCPSPSTNLLASSSKDKTVRLWTPSVKGDVSVFTAHTAAVRTVRFSNDGRYLLTASDDKTLKLWSAPRAKFMATLTGHANWVRSAAWSPDDSMVASGSDDKTIRLWDPSAAKASCIKVYQQVGGEVTHVQFHPLGSLVGAACTDGAIKLWDIRTHRLVQVQSLAFGGPKGEWMISTGGDGVVKVWDLVEGHLLYTLHGHKENLPTTAAVFSPRGEYFATGGMDGQVFVWKSNLLAGTGEPAIPGLGTGGVTAAGGQDAAGQQEVVNLGPPLFADTKTFGRRPPTSTSNPRPPTTSRTKPPAPHNPSPPTLPGTASTSADDQPTTSPLEIKSLPLSLTTTLETIVAQLDVLTSSMQLFEHRLGACEERLQTSLASSASTADSLGFDASQESVAVAAPEQEVVDGGRAPVSEGLAP